MTAYYKNNDENQRPSPTSTILSPYKVLQSGEHGTEVAFRSTTDNEDTDAPLEEIPLNNQTPRKQYRHTKSLLDQDLTPSPLRQQTTNVEATTTLSFFSCCGGTSTAISCWSPTTLLTQNDTRFQQQQIHSLLGSPIAHDCWWNGWQVLCSSSIEQDPRMVSTHLHRVLKNRALYVKQRQEHLDSLRIDLNPFSPTKVVMAKTLSFHQESTPKHKKSQRNTLLCECSSPKQETLPTPEDCYDSDPEDFTRNRSWNRPDKKRSDFRQKPMTTIQWEDDDSLRYAVAETMNELWTLIWHDPSLSSSRAVTAWIERGQILCNGDILPPKFVWKHTSTKTTRKQSQRIHTFSVDLLDIHRVLEVERVRNFLARRSTLLVVQTLQGKSFQFQARDMASRNRLVLDLKLVVARLGALLVCSKDDHEDWKDFFLEAS